MFDGVLEMLPYLLNEIIEMIYVNAVKYFKNLTET